MHSAFWLPAAIAITTATAAANEITVQNDSLTDNSSGTIEAGFVPGEKAAAWLTSPCAGDIVAVQVFWRSLFGTAPQSLEDSIDIYRSGDFPDPGDLAQEILGPLLTDGVLNEYRYLDENNTVPLLVPVDPSETFVVALTFANTPNPVEGPSVVIDDDGMEPGRNAIYAALGGGEFQWFSNATFNVDGDWVIRAVVDCQSAPTEADVSVAIAADPAWYTPGQALAYTITVANAGPAAAANTTVVDAFPSALTGVAWTCAGSGGATCPASGSGTMAASVGLPAGGAAVFTASGIVAAGTSGTLSDSATAVVGGPATDPDPTNNTASVDTEPAADDVIFADGFDAG